MSQTSVAKNLQEQKRPGEEQRRPCSSCVAILPLPLSGCSSRPAAGSVPSLVSFSFPFVLGFFATGGGTLASPSTFVGEGTSWCLGAGGLVSVTGLLSTTTFLLLLAKIKLAVLEGDLRRSGGDVGQWRLRREAGPPKDLDAVRRRIASCRFIEAAGGDFVVRDGTEGGDAGGTTRGSDVGAGGCEVAAAGGDAGEGELKIRDFLIGFCGASALDEEAGFFFLITTSVSGSSCTCGSSELLSAGLDSSSRLGRSCAGTGGGKGLLTGADGAFSVGGGLSGLGWLEFSDGAELENVWIDAPSVFAASAWWRSSVGGADGIL